MSFPDTRWTYLAQVSKRHIKVLPVLDATYEKLSSDDPASMGRLRQLKDLKLLYTITIIANVFTDTQVQIILKH